MKVLNKNDGYDYGLVEKVFDTVLPQNLSNELAIYDTSFLISHTDGKFAVCIGVELILSDESIHDTSFVLDDASPARLVKNVENNITYKNMLNKYRIKDIVVEPQEEKIDIYTKYGAYFDEGEYLMYEAFYKIPLNSHSLSVIAVVEAAKQFAGLK